MASMFLLLENILILLAIIAIVFALYWGSAPKRTLLIALWQGAAIFCAFAALFVALPGSGLGYEVFFLKTRSWTVFGDVVLVFVSFGYGLAIMAAIKTLQFLRADRGQN